MIAVIKNKTQYAPCTEYLQYLHLPQFMIININVGKYSIHGASGRDAQKLEISDLIDFFRHSA